MTNQFKKIFAASYNSHALRISVIIILTIMHQSAGAQVLSQKDERFVDSVMNANYTSTGPGAVLLIAKNGTPVFKKAYGLASLELQVSQRTDYTFDIASMSKQFTAVCILKLAQEGKLNLQDDIRKYLPTYNTHGRHITIENILTHTSGIMDYTEKNEYAAKSVSDQSKEDLCRK